MVGDVDFQAVKEVAGKITPVGDVVYVCCGLTFLGGKNNKMKKIYEVHQWVIFQICCG